MARRGSRIIGMRLVPPEPSPVLVVTRSAKAYAFCWGLTGPPGFIPPRRCPVQSCERRVTGAGTRPCSQSVRAQFNFVLGGVIVRYQLKQIYCRPWTLSGLSLKLMESHYEN